MGVAIRVVDRAAVPGARTTEMRTAALLIVALTYLVVSIARCRRTSASPPRTEQLIDPRIRRCYAHGAGDDERLARFIFRNERMSVAGVGLAVFAGLIAARGAWMAVGVVIAAGTMSALVIVTWCWWRITETFYTFLRNYSLFNPKVEAKIG
jgi:hypothetical protein